MSSSTNVTYTYTSLEIRMLFEMYKMCSMKLKYDVYSYTHITDTSMLNRMNDLKTVYRMSLSPLYLSIETSPIIINRGRSANESRSSSCQRGIIGTQKLVNQSGIEN